MAPPTNLAEGRPALQPTVASPESMYPDAKAPQIISQTPDSPKDLQVVGDNITGSQRIVTVLGSSVERAISNDARMLAWGQRVQGGWVNAGIEALDYYPVDLQGKLVEDRHARGPFMYHSRWRLTLTG